LAHRLPKGRKLDSGKRFTPAYPGLRRPDGSSVAMIRLARWTCPKMSREPNNLRQKRHRQPPASRDSHLSSGIIADFGDNAVNRIVAFRAQGWRRERKVFDWKQTMSSLSVKLGLVMAAGLMLSGCVSTTYEATNQTTFKPRDKELLAKIRYTNVPVAEPFRRAIVEYHRKEAPGSIVVDSDNHYLYYVLDSGKAIRYGITVGEEAMAWSGIAKIGSMTEWPPWHPTKSEIERLGVPTFVPPGPDNPMGSRAMYLYSGGKDTLFRIHGTNQPEYIGASISSGCIRMTNEDVIDLYNRVKMGTIVVVLEPHHGDSPYNPQMALQGGPNG
jgi:lipoprotein-anchoring transpeptidase ErfK/SrfK